MYIIAGIVVVVIIIAAVFASGVMSKPPERAITPTIPVTMTTKVTTILTTKVTPTPVTTMAVPGSGSATPVHTVAQVKDPIVGVWRYSSGDYDFRYRFNAEGTFEESSYNPKTLETVSIHGSWIAAGGNSYNIVYGSGDPSVFIYVPTQNTIYETKYPTIIYSPYQGDVAPASSSSGYTSASTSINSPKYNVGDIVGQASGVSDGDLIISYTSQSDRYTVQTVHKQNGVWKYYSWAPTSYGREFEESYDPIMLGHMNPQSVEAYTWN